MKSISITAVIGLTLAGLVFAGTSTEVAADEKNEIAHPGAGMTIYMDISVMGRKKRAAKRMTELHAEQFENGWRVIDVEPYIENGDLQGFFVTYVGRD